MNPLTVQELQAYLRRWPGRIDGLYECATASIEFGTDGGGVVMTSWDRMADEAMDGVEDRVDFANEFANATELALMVRTDWMPEPVEV